MSATTMNTIKLNNKDNNDNNCNKADIVGDILNKFVIIYISCT